MAGKPTRYLTPEEIEKCAELAGKGLTNVQIAQYFGMKKDWFNARLKDQETLKPSLEKGKAQALANVTGKLYEQCMKGNLGAIIFYLKCRGGWSEMDVEDTEQEQYKRPNSLRMA